MQVRYTAQGQVVVFAGNVIDVYSTQLEELQTTIATPSPTGAWPYTHVFGLSDDGRVAAVIHPNATHNYAEVHDLVTKVKSVIDLGPLADGSVQPDDVALSPGGDLLFVVSGVHSTSGFTAMYDTTTGLRLWTEDKALTPIYSPDESTVYGIGGYGSNVTNLQAFDTRTGVTTLDVPTSSPLGRLSVQGTTNQVVGLTTSPQSSPCTPDDLCAPQITFYAAADGSVTKEFPLSAHTEPEGISPQGLPAFRCSQSVGLCTLPVIYDPPSAGAPQQPQVQVWTTSGTLVQSLDVAGIDADVSPDGQFLVVITGDQNDVAVYRLSDGSLAGARHYGGDPS